jgi:hypothetical protein
VSPDARRSAPAAARNREPLLEVLRAVLPAAGAPGTVLEIASGSGEHALHFADALPGLFFQPSDPDSESRESIAAWRQHAGLANLRAPLALDATQEPTDWPLSGVAPPLRAILCINMIHIAPWEACLGLLAGASHWLGAGDPLLLYGPFRRAGVHTAPSNDAFDVSLRSRDSRWGVRDLEAVSDEASRRGFALDRVVAMPANNFSVVLRRE